MNRPPSDSSHSSSLPLAANSSASSLRILSIFLLGLGLGTLAAAGLTPKPSPISTGYLGSIQASQSRSQPHAELTASAVKLADVSSATVCVKTPKGPGEQACASGVSIDPQLVGLDPAAGAVVLTNYHVIMDMGNRPPLQLGGRGEIFSAEIIRTSPEFDLALLRVPSAQFPIAALAEISPAQGTAVRAIGFPNDQPLTIKNSSLLGKTQNCLAVSPCLALQQGTITFGNSGGPLEANGQVIGITQGEIEDELAIPVEQIRQFLAGQQPARSASPQFNSADPGLGSGYPPMPEYMPEPMPDYYMQEPAYAPYPPFYPPDQMAAPPYPAW